VWALLRLISTGWGGDSVPRLFDVIDTIRIDVRPPPCGRKSLRLPAVPACVALRQQLAHTRFDGGDGESCLGEVELAFSITVSDCELKTLFVDHLCRFLRSHPKTFRQADVSMHR
jgi:hypothetical protein